MGANIVQVASAMYKSGPEILESWIEETNKWLDTNGVESINSITGKLRQADSLKPLA